MSSAALVDLDRTVILPLLVPILSVSLLDASNSVYTIASQPVSKHTFFTWQMGLFLSLPDIDYHHIACIFF